MKSIHYIIYIALAVLSFTACQEDELVGNVQGGIRITLAEEVGVDVSTRSTPEELDIPMATDFKIEATNSAGDKKYSGTFKKDETIPLDAGTYEVIAYYGINNTLALDAPYYEGIAENIDVKEGYTTPVTLTCKVANSLLSIRINEDDKEKFDEAFKTPSFQLTVGGKSVATSDITKSFYFKAGSTISKLAFSKDGSDYQDLEIKNWPKEIKAADHIIVTVGIEPAPSGITLTVEKVKVQTVTIEETIPMEWLPKPSVSATGFDTNNSLTFAETETKEAKLDLKLASALQDIKFKFNFEDEQFSLDKEKEYVWSNEEDKKVISEQLGINVSDKSVDLNGLLAKLQTNAGVSTTNAIEVDVKANDRWSSEDKEANRKYTITCNKPEFSIAVQEGNVWTRTFTIDEPTVTAGNAEVLKEKLVYQYKEKDANDDAWQTCSNELEQIFTEHPANKEYQVRAFYREGIVSDVVDVMLEMPEQLPNANMDAWSNETYDEGRYSFNPWDSNETPFWDTNNDYTTRHRHNSSSVTMANYNGFHAVSYVQGREGNGLAAELRSTANGRGNTRVELPSWLGGTQHSEKDINKIAGKLFTGTANVEMTGNDINGDDTYTEEKNASFNSRPTSLTFYYKYAPYNSDIWSVHIELLDENKNVIIQNEKTSSEAKNDWTQESVSLDYVDGTAYAKCKYIYVIFKSTTNEGANMPYREITQTFYVLENGSLSTHSYEPAYIGSVLTIDDIQLIYNK